MAEPFLSEIRMMSFNFPPSGWAFCNGQVLSVSQNQALYALVQNLYGGTAPSTFALPNLQGATPIHFGRTPSPNSATYAVGQSGGEAAHTLTINEIPAHTHTVMASSGGPDQGSPAGNYLAGIQAYASAGDGTTLNAQSVSNAGGQPHSNMQPYLPIAFCIALKGIYPSRS